MKVSHFDLWLYEIEIALKPNWNNLLLYTNYYCHNFNSRDYTLSPLNTSLKHLAIAIHFSFHKATSIHCIYLQEISKVFKHIKEHYEIGIQR